MNVCLQVRRWLFALSTYWCVGIVTTNSDEFVTIASMIPKEQFVYPGQTFDVKCTTRSSTILAWRSPEYIGSGDQLGFASINHPGMMWSNSQGSATAKLDDVNQTEPIIMKSTITITVLDSDKFTSFTIFCHNVDHDKSANITFHKSELSVQVDDHNNHTCINRSDYIQFTCTLGGSSSFQWSCDELFGTINHSRDDSPSDIITTSNGNYILLVRNNTNGIFTSTLIFSAVYLPVDRRVNITCLNVERGTEDSIYYGAPDDCPPTDSPSTTTLKEPSGSTSLRVTISYHRLVAVSLLVSYLTRFS